MESNLWSFGILKKILFSFEWLEEKAFDLKLLYSKGTDRGKAWQEFVMKKMPSRVLYSFSQHRWSACHRPALS